MSRLVLLRHRSASLPPCRGDCAGVAGNCFLSVTAPQRIDPALQAALRAGAPVAVAVTLGFAPENFHIRLFQSYGVVNGVRWHNRVLESCLSGRPAPDRPLLLGKADQRMQSEGVQ